MLTDGPRGMEYLTGPPDDLEMDEHELAVYGIDWEARQDVGLMGHLLQNHPHDWEEDNPFRHALAPATMSEVICPPPRCPFNSEQCEVLDLRLVEQVDWESRDMQVRKFIWAEALEICCGVFSIPSV
jgi:hypothetical protein